MSGPRPGDRRPRARGEAISGEAIVVRGAVEFVWDSDGAMLVTIDPDHPGAPHTFEITGALRDGLAAELAEGAEIEITYLPVEHEVVDPDAGPSETVRAEVRAVRLVHGRAPS